MVDFLGLYNLWRIKHAIVSRIFEFHLDYLITINFLDKLKPVDFQTVICYENVTLIK